MEQVVQLPKIFIYKIGGLLCLLMFGAAFMVTENVMSVLKKGPSMSILFANEYALTLISLIGSCIRFALNCMDAFNPDQAFEQRSTVIFYLDFFVDLFKLLIYTGFFAVVMAYYGLPIHIIRDLYVTIISFTKRVRDMIKYHQIMSNLQTRYPDVTQEELKTCNDPTCIICREEMVTAVKRLPCGHFFHFKCLKSWLERQQVCPTCRKSVLDTPPKPVSYPAEQRREFDETNSQVSGTNSQFSRTDSQVSRSNPQLSNYQDALNRSNNSSTTRLLLSPLRRTHSTPSLHPVQSALLLNEDEKEVLISEGERLKIAAELERIGRRSKSPLPDNIRDSNHQIITNDACPLSPLSHVKSKIEYVEELMVQHENILTKLRQVENEIIRERSFSFSRSASFNLDDKEIEQPDDQKTQ
jgi:hypothetical protein